MDIALRLIALCPQTPHNREGGGGPVRSFYILNALAMQHEVSLAILDTGALVPEPLASRCRLILRPEPIRNAPSKPNAPARSAIVAALGFFKANAPELLTAAERNCVVRGEDESHEARGPLKRLGHQLYAWSLLTTVVFRSSLFGLRPARGSERVVFYHALLEAIQQAHRQHPFTHIWVEHSYLFPEALDLSKRLGGLPLMVNAHNVEHVLHRRMGDLMRSASARAWYALQARYMRRVEAAGYRRADWVLCCSAEDAEWVRQLAPDVRAQVVANGVDTDFMQPGAPEAAEPLIAYVGSFGYFPNVDAVTFFHADILPCIRRAVPNCHFTIIGYGAERFAALAEQDPYISIAANVADIRPYLARAWVVVVPLRTGSGTRLKILDAMAMGKPVVSTRVGAEGIAPVARGIVRVADEPAAFADQVVELIGNSEHRRILGRQGRQLAEEVFSWTVIGQQIQQGS